MQRMTVAALHQNFGIEPGLDHVGRAPLACYQGVMSQMPPEVVGEILGPALDLPLSQNLEAVRIQNEDASGTFTIGSAECADENSVRAAVDGVRATVTGSLRERLRFDYFDDSWIPRIGFRVNDVNS